MECKVAPSLLSAAATYWCCTPSANQTALSLQLSIVLILMGSQMCLQFRHMCMHTSCRRCRSEEHASSGRAAQMEHGQSCSCMCSACISCRGRCMMQSGSANTRRASTESHSASLRAQSDSPCKEGVQIHLSATHCLSYVFKSRAIVPTGGAVDMGGMPITLPSVCLLEGPTVNCPVFSCSPGCNRQE